MRKILLLVIVILGYTPVLSAQTIVAARTIRPQSVLSGQDIRLLDQSIPGTYISVDEVVGQEARVVLYSGRPIRIGDIGPPALIERNQIVTLLYKVGSLSIATEARALARGGLGDRIRVMNLASRATVMGWVRADGTVSVSPPPFPSQ